MTTSMHYNASLKLSRLNELCGVKVGLSIPIVHRVVSIDMMRGQSQHRVQCLIRATSSCRGESLIPNK